MKKAKKFLTIIVCTLPLMLSCGGGGGGGGTTTSTISGVASTGKPLASFKVLLKDSSGIEENYTTNAQGEYTFDTTDLKPPFYLRVENQELFSYTNSQSGTANINPLSTAVIAVANSGDPDVYSSPKTLDDGTLSKALTNVQDFLKPILEKFNALNVDPIKDKFQADGIKLDAVFDVVEITVNSDTKTIQVDNQVTQETVGEATIEQDATVQVSNPVDSTEVVNLAPPSISRYFAYVNNGIESGPIIVDMQQSGNSIAVAATSFNGDTGKPMTVQGTGTISGSNVHFELPVILCRDTASSGTGLAKFDGTINSDGSISGTFTNDLPQGDSCKPPENPYGTWFAEKPSSTLSNFAGTWDAYVRTSEGDSEQGPVTLVIQQSNNAVTFSLSVNGDKRKGTGVVYGNYVIFTIPVILCNDTCGNGPCQPAENATFIGKISSDERTMTGSYGDGIYAGDSCREPERAIGSWRAEKQ